MIKSETFNLASLVYFIIQNLSLHLALGIKRLREGFEIKELGIEQEVSDRVEYQVAQRIVQRIEVIADASAITSIR